MISRFLGFKTFQNILFFAYLVFAAGIPLTKIALSLSTIFIALIILFEGNFKMYYEKIKSNKISLWIGLFFLFHLLSLIWSEDLTYALLDLKSKLTFYVIAFALIIYPPESRKRINYLLGIFLLAVLIASLVNFGTYFHWWGSRHYADIREMSLFTSHIRFSLMISMSAGIVFWWFLENPFDVRNKKPLIRITWLLLFAWFAIYTYYSQVLSGLLTFGGMLALIFIFLTLKSKSLIFKISALSLFTLGFIFLVVELTFYLKPNDVPFEVENLATHTKEGNPYKHILSDLSEENGFPVYFFLCEPELKREWNLRSSIPYDSLDGKNQWLRQTLIRYMTSKGLKKDAEGFLSLSDEDIENIESGITSVSYLTGGVKQRLKELRLELKPNQNPNISGLLQRIEFWKTGWKIFKKHPFLGVGPGDIENAFQEQYELDDSPLLPENRWQSHNQFLSYLVTYGLIGCVFFFGFLFYFLKQNILNQNLLGLIFFVIAMLSFFIEDTLETQMGIAFFSFFFGLFSSTGNSRRNVINQ